MNFQIVLSRSQLMALQSLLVEIARHVPPAELTNEWFDMTASPPHRTTPSDLLDTVMAAMPVMSQKS